MNPRHWIWLGLYCLIASAFSGEICAAEKSAPSPISTNCRPTRRVNVRSTISAAKRKKTPPSTIDNCGPTLTPTVKSARPSTRGLSSPGDIRLASVTSSGEESPADALHQLLQQPAAPIDLRSALQLAGEQNPSILLGQQRVVEAVALRQLAAAQFLPTLNLGTSVDSHWGVLQQSNGNILSVRREAGFVGAGANAIAAGTVNIPGVVWTANVSDTVFGYLVARQEVDRRQLASQAIGQDQLLVVALAYNDLVRAEEARNIVLLSLDDARELARIMSAFVESGQGRKPDADRAAVELARRESQLVEVEGSIIRASASLCQRLHLDPSLRLHSIDNQVIPRSIVPDPIPLPELLAIALIHRPELNESRSKVEQSLLRLKGAKLLPFSPTVFLGFSAGGFGGGSDLVAQPVTSIPFGRGDPRFSTLDDREDLDVMAYWTLQNLGVGNKSQIAAARSRAASADLEMLVKLDRIRAEVASAQARVFARFARISTCELAVKSSKQAFAEDMERVLGGEALPLEAIDSLRLLADSRLEYLDAIIDYNAAQFELYVALGRPPGEVLLRPAEVPLPEESRRRSRSKIKLASVDEPADESQSKTRQLEGLLPTNILPPTYDRYAIDLPTALRLAEGANPTIALGRQAIVEAEALQTGARGLLLPTLNAGSNYHLHQGVLQTSYGQIRNLNEQSIYVGAGARTLAAETLAIPGVRIFSHLGDAYFAPLAAGQIVCARTFDASAIENQTLLTVVERYLDLAMAEASLDAIHQAEEAAQSIVKSTSAFSETGQGREGDYQRARADALLLHAQEQTMQELVAVRSAELSRVLHLDPSIRLHTPPGPLELVQLIDPSFNVDQLTDFARAARPELAARTAELAAAEYRVRQEKTRPFFPVVSVGFSGGAFGGGSNRQDLGVPSFFQTFGGRTDFDVTAVWTLQNLGFGNAAIQKQTRAERDTAIAARSLQSNRIAREVGDAFAKSQTRRQQVELAEMRLKSAVAGANEELERTRGGEGLPIEALNSARMLSEAGLALVEAIGGYDLAQFELFVAIGQTPHSALPDPRRARASGN